VSKVRTDPISRPLFTILSIALVDGTFHLIWAASAVGYELQSALEWNVPAGWVSVPGIPIAEGDRRVVTVLPAETARYFRLAGF